MMGAHDAAQEETSVSAGDLVAADGQAGCAEAKQDGAGLTLEDGLVGHWTFEGLSSAGGFPDSSSNGNDGDPCSGAMLADTVPYHDSNNSNKHSLQMNGDCQVALSSANGFPRTRTSTTRARLEPPSGRISGLKRDGPLL
jgi:hypothetical protein